MQELLSVNERYHETLNENGALRRELETLRAEVQGLRTALARSEAKCEQQAQQLSTVLSTSEQLREANELSGARSSAAEAQKGEMQQLLEACMGQLASQQKELEALHRLVERAESSKQDAFQQGFDDGLAQRQTEHASRLRKVQTASKSQAAQAFESGRLEASNEQAAALLREQAHRRLLLHRAEEQRQQKAALTSRLARERRARADAQEKREEFEVRLQATRWAKGAVEGELQATRTAHAQ
eukprot:7359320-Prymnesium_polylepis.1